jgi:hypothetical protein
MPIARVPQHRDDGSSEPTIEIPNRIPNPPVAEIPNEITELLPLTTNELDRSRSRAVGTLD